MAETARADPVLIPRALGHDDAEYTVATRELHYDANYQLLHDNLLDLT